MGDLEDRVGEIPANEDVPVPHGYAFESCLGQGGMGAVYRVRDLRSGEILALKRLILPESEDERSAATAKLFSELFEREYHTLAQLEHPRVIDVRDFGIDWAGPYYTMELLEGADVRNVAPLPWQEACAVVRDAASSLALLHSRRLLHRDVSPRNVRRTADGRAKLLDFGAMTSFGVARDIVGTVPCIAPESIRGEPLDPRSDIFSLGTTLYFALTGRWPYRAARIGELPAAWRVPPAPPSDVAPGVPAALDALVLAMLSIDPRGRPDNAAEVIDRLEGIAGLTPVDPLGVAQAYLNTPILVARDAMLASFRGALARAHRSQGAILYVEAEPGLGRTRLLHAFGLEAKLSGAVVLAADPNDALAGAFGLARVWVDELLRSRPDVAIREARPFASTLGYVSAELHARLGHPELEPFDTPQQRSLRIQVDLRAWLERVVRAHRVCLLVDDLGRADPESAGLVAGLTERARSSRLVLVVSAPDGSGAAGDALGGSGVERLVRESSTIVRLSPLEPVEVEALFRSVFGEAPRVELLSAWMHRQTAGNPGRCMELAHYLLEREQVRFESGLWVLPANPEALDVPAAHEERLAQRLDGLAQDARALVECRALALDVAPLGLHDLAHLLEGEDRVARVRSALAELSSRDLVVHAGSNAGYVFAQRALANVIRTGLDADVRRARHVALARAYLASGDRPLVASHHALGAGDAAGALDCLLDADVDPAEVPAAESAAVVPVIEAALDEAKRQGRSNRDQIRLLTMLLGCCATVDRDFSRYTGELTRHMRRDSGLDAWQVLDPDQDPGERSRQALAKAQADYDAADPAERGLPPAEAITLMGQTLGAIVVFAARARDTRAIYEATDLLAPLASLSPMAGFQYETLSTAARYTAGLEIGDAYRRSARSARDDQVVGLPPGARTQTYLLCGFYDAWIECDFDRHVGWIEEVAEALLRDPVFRVQGWQLRLAYHAVRGNAVEMAACRRSRDLAMVESALTHQHASTGLLFDLAVAVRMRDLLALKRLRAPLDEEAARFPLWRATALHAHAEYHLARGELDRARHHCEEALRAATPGEVAQWASLVRSCLRIMLMQGDVEAACARGREALQVAREVQVRWRQVASIELGLGLVEVAAGRHADGFARIEGVATAMAEAAYAGDEVLQVQVEAALAAGDAGRFGRALEAFGAFCSRGQHPALLALYEQFAELGRRRFEGARAGAESDPEEVRARNLVRARLRLSGDSSERVRRVLALLAEVSGAAQGYLFALRQGVLASLGSQEGTPAPEAVGRAVRDYFSLESEFLTEMTVTQLSGTVAARTEWVIDGAVYEPATLACRIDDEPCLAGVVVLQYPAELAKGPPPALLLAVAEQLAELGDAEPIPVLDL